MNTDALITPIDWSEWKTREFKTVMFFADDITEGCWQWLGGRLYSNVEREYDQNGFVWKMTDLDNVATIEEKNWANESEEPQMIPEIHFENENDQLMIEHLPTILEWALWMQSLLQEAAKTHVFQVVVDREVYLVKAKERDEIAGKMMAAGIIEFPDWITAISQIKANDFENDICGVTC